MILSRWAADSSSDPSSITTGFGWMIEWAGDSHRISVTTGFHSHRISMTTVFRCMIGWMIDSGWAAIPRPGPTKTNDGETAVRREPEKELWRNRCQQPIHFLKTKHLVSCAAQWDGRCWRMQMFVVLCAKMQMFAPSETAFCSLAARAWGDFCNRFGKWVEDRISKISLRDGEARWSGILTAIDSTLDWTLARGPLGGPSLGAPWGAPRAGLGYNERTAAQVDG